MKVKNLVIKKVIDETDIPYDLLLLADPSMQQIKQYLQSGDCYIAQLKEQTIGVIVIAAISKTVIEIKNIAVQESFQGKGFGKQLIDFATTISQDLGYQKIVIGTGNSSIHQLAMYQKMGFEMTRIEKDFFFLNYDEPIIENGIQCKHKIILEKVLSI